MEFIVYDIFLLIIFVLSVSAFLYSRRKNIRKEGLLFLYRTKLGIRLINYIGKKYKKTLRVSSYASIFTGYILMISAIYFIGKIAYIYIALPSAVKAIKVPPIMPLVPYIDKVVPSLPSFYFTYWIIILAVIAISHEFFHGIFSVYNKVKVKTTGFGFFPYFLPVFLAAFVELDEKKMEKKSKLSQMAVLSAGTFANVLTAILFFVMLILFFSSMFVPAGIQFNSYPYSFVHPSNITSINGKTIENFSELLLVAEEGKLNAIETNYGKKYFAEKNFLESHASLPDFVILYEDAPAIKAGIKPEEAIIEINRINTNSIKKFKEQILNVHPGETAEIKTKNILTGEIKEYSILLEKNPSSESNISWLGVGFISQERSGIIGKLYSLLSGFKNPSIYYEPKYDEISNFIYNLLWWIVLISISVAIVNMLPVGIFDGGRFFYLTVLGITKSEKIAKKAFAFVTYMMLFLLLVMMIFWFFRIW